VVTATAVTAQRRETWGGHEAPMPEVPRPQDVPRTLRRGVEWLHRYDMRFLTGGIPREWDGQDVGDSLSRLWVRDEPPRPLDFPSLTAACRRVLPARVAAPRQADAAGHGQHDGVLPRRQRAAARHRRPATC
jgi:hypothetical protein